MILLKLSATPFWASRWILKARVSRRFYGQSWDGKVSLCPSCPTTLWNGSCCILATCILGCPTPTWQHVLNICTFRGTPGMVGIWWYDHIYIYIYYQHLSTIIVTQYQKIWSLTNIRMSDISYYIFLINHIFLYLSHLSHCLDIYIYGSHMCHSSVDMAISWVVPLSGSAFWWVRSCFLGAALWSALRMFLGGFWKSQSQKRWFNQHTGEFNQQTCWY